MLKKCLIALVLMVVSSAPVFGHAMWDYGITTTVQWEWTPKIVGPICVQMRVVMWADLYWDGCIMLHQVENDVFVGCIVAQLCVNFTKIKVEVEYEAMVDITTATDNKGYFIDISRKVAGQDCAPSFPAEGKLNPKDSINVDDGPYLMNNTLPLCICVKVIGVDPQTMAYNEANPLAPVQVGKVWATLTPRINPPGAPASGTELGTGNAASQLGLGGSLIP
jgi:hypothetical protein